MAKKAPATKVVKETKGAKAIKKDKAAPAKKAEPKEAKGASKKAAPKKEEKLPVVALKLEKSKSKSSAKQLDLCLLLDCTGSMASWIERSKDTLGEIIDTVKSNNPDLNVRVCFVGYRDIEDRERFSIKDFSDDVNDVKKFIATVSANGGGDFPEDVQGGFNKALNMKWGADSVKQVFHIFDAPGHGKDICDGGDDYPAGSPEGFKIQDQMKEFARMKINFTCVKVNDKCNKMIKVMTDSYTEGGMVLNITDLA